MKQFLVFIFTIAFSVLGFAQTYQEIEADVQMQKQQMINDIESTLGIKVTNPKDIAMIEAGLRYENQPRMQKMSNGRVVRFMACVSFNGDAVLVGGGYASCFARGGSYTIGQVNVGAQLGFAFRINAGVFIAEPGAPLEGKYRGVDGSLGLAGGGITGTVLTSKDLKRQIVLAGIEMTFFHAGASVAFVEVKKEERDPNEKSFFNWDE